MSDQKLSKKDLRNIEKLKALIMKNASYGLKSDILGTMPVAERNFLLLTQIIITNFLRNYSASFTPSYDEEIETKIHIGELEKLDERKDKRALIYVCSTIYADEKKFLEEKRCADLMSDKTKSLSRRRDDCAFGYLLQLSLKRDEKLSQISF